MHPYQMSILVNLAKEKSTSKLITMDKKTLKKKLDEKEKVSDRTFRTRINELVLSNLVDEGKKIGNLKTYYVTEKGLKFLYVYAKEKNS